MFNNNPEQLIGQQFGNYRLTKFLNGGGFGFVYQATHIKLPRTVAIKLLKPDFVHEKEYMEAFEREAQLVASLKHENILDILDYDNFKGVPYIVMPFIERGSLRTVHPDGTILNPNMLLSYGKQIANALQYAHDRKIVHRDIKPDNFLLGPQGVLLSDFGIAITAHGFDSMTWQDLGGSAHYMAPEQWEHKAQIWSDQYSLAVVIYKWLSGKLPFYGTRSELSLKHKNEMPPRFKQQGVNIPFNVEQVVRKGLEKDPRARYPRVTEFADQLEKAILESQAKLRTSQAATKEPLAAQKDQIPQRKEEKSREPQEQDKSDPAKKVGIFGFGKQKPAEAPATPNAPTPNTPDAPVKRLAQALPPAYAPSPQQQGQGYMGENAALAGSADLAAQAQNNAANVPSAQPVQPVPNMSPASSAASGGPIVFGDAGDDDIDENDANWMPPLVPAPMPQPIPVVGAGGKAGPDPIELSPWLGKPTIKLPAEPAAVAPVVVPPPVTPQRRDTRKTPAFATGAALEAAVVAANRVRGAVVALLSLAHPNTRRDANNPSANRSPKRAHTILLVLSLLLLTALLACGGLAYAYPGTVQNTLGAVPHLFTPGAVDVTITPKNQVVSHSYVITTVTGTPSVNPQDRQIKAIPLSYTTPATKSQPVETTGRKDINPTPAHGTLIFSNSAGVAYTFGSKSLITSMSGVTMYLDAPVTIPAAVPGVSFGHATQTATTVTTGTGANIPAGDVNISSTTSSISIKNDAPFTGGQDAQHYNYATQNDVNTAAASLQASLQQQAQNALQTKATVDQPLADNITCTPKVTPDQPVGDTGTAVNTLTVTVTATCNAEAYDAKGLRTLMGTLLQEQANTDLGQGYTLRGNLLTKVSVVDVNTTSGVAHLNTTSGVAHLNTNAQGRYAYNLDNQVNALKTLLKGLSVEKARAILLGQAGVSDVQFPNGTTTMPTDVNQINIIIAYPQGFTTSGGPTASPSSTPTGANG